MLLGKETPMTTMSRRKSHLAEWAALLDVDLPDNAGDDRENGC